MKRSLLLLAILFSVSLSARIEFLKPHAKSSRSAETSRAFSFNYLGFDAKPMNGYLDRFGMRQAFDSKFYAIGYEDFAESYPIDAAICVAWMLPQEGWAGVNSDSLNFKLGGWQIMMSILGFDLVRSEKVNFTIGPMWNFGNYRMKKNAAGESMKKYTNPFVSPGGRVDLQFYFGKFLIGGRAMYCYDISDPKWKRKSPNLEILPGTYNRGLNYAAYIGWTVD